MLDFLEKTWKLNRSIVSDDFQITLEIIKERIPLTIHRYPTGKECFTWILPKHWSVSEAYIEDENGSRLIDLSDNGLHVVIGALPVDKWVSRDELMEKLYISDYFPDNVPYVFKYYELDWGFCCSKKDLKKFKGDRFRVFIDSKYSDGDLLVGEHTIVGEEDRTILLLAHVDHPFQVNDGLSGVALLVALAEHLQKESYTFPYTIKMLFVPERIGSIAYLHDNMSDISKYLGGIFLEMTGTPEYPVVLQHSIKPESRLDRMVKYTLESKEFSFGEADCSGNTVNDDGFLNSPGIEIPCISLCRSKPLKPDEIYHFPGYHTNADNMDNFNFAQAEELLELMKGVMNILAKDRLVIRKFIGTPCLSRYRIWIDFNKYPNECLKVEAILSHLDNRSTIFDIASNVGCSFDFAYDFIVKMEEKGLVDLLISDTI